MTERYWIGGFYVDVSRNQITHNKQVQTLPPKALEVLTYLAKHKGEVVSQEDLLNYVWKETVVSPNTLQRCIAQLRKAFGDSGKAQGFIKTHAKKGYSLEADIRWQETDAPLVALHDPAVNACDSTPPSFEKEGEEVRHRTHKAAKNKLKLKLTLILIILSLSLLLYGAWVYETPRSTTPADRLHITDIRLLTSTDDRELASAYSPDGKFIVFQRFPEVMCQSHLWAKHIDTQQEFQLTQSLGSYGSLAFSPNGKTLSFIKENDCSAPVEQKTCYHLQTLDFAKALTAPQSPHTLMECKSSKIKSPVWMDDDTIALLQKTQGRWRLIRYAISQNESAPLYEVANGSIVSFDFAARDNTLALTTVHEKGILHIEKLSINGELLSSAPIDYQGVIPPYHYIYPNTLPEQNHLVFSTGKQLFTIDFEGNIHRISMPLTDAIGTPLFHPFEKKMLAIKGHYDSDIVAVPLDQFARHDRHDRQLNAHVSTNTAKANDVGYHTIIRSMLEENRAKYQPGGSLIAYSSEGDGTSQVWITDTQTQNATLPFSGKPFSQFPTNTYVRDVLWAEDGGSILINASSQLKQLYLGGIEHDFDIDQEFARDQVIEPGQVIESSIELGFPVRDVFDWDSKQQTVLANILHQGVLTFVSIDLSTGAFTRLSDKAVTWAVKTDSGTLIFTDAEGRFWKVGNIENTLITALEDQESNRHFIATGDTLYGINDNFQLWRFTLESGALELLGQLPDTVDYITDVNDEAILLTLRVAARKDVVELTLE